MENKRIIALIGGGLAGSFMALRLVEKGYYLIWFDEDRVESASKVAAGLFNVITGRFGALNWQAKLLLKELSDLLETKSFEPLQKYVHFSEIYRPFKEYEEYNKWTSKSEELDYKYFVDFQEKSLLSEILHNDLGGILIKNCGWLAVKEAIEELKKRLRLNERVNFFNKRLAHTQVDVVNKRIRVEESWLHFDEIIFCEGYLAAQNPLWKHLKIIPNKGEVLTVYANDLHLPFVLSKKVYVIPRGSQTFVVGATYDRKFKNFEPSVEGREELEMYLRKAIKVPYQIIDHAAGIRPTTPNRRPIIGTHPDYPYVHVCSGLGSKGVLYGPYCTHLLMQHISGVPRVIPPTLDAARFC